MAQQLAEHYSGTLVPEYARFYMQQLLEKRTYNYDDVCNVAKKQIEQLWTDYPTKYVFFDTELIITKVWFLDKYGKLPEFFEKALENNPIDFYLLLKPDLPFVPDPVRENPTRREELFLWYRKELNEYGFRYKIIDEIGDFRLKKAIEAIDNFIKM